MKFTIGPVMVGPALPFRGQERSGIFKHRVAGRVTIGPLGLDGDEQGDKQNHGGVDMAVHHYPHDHYALWVAEIGPHELLEAPGGFGENITTDGLTEEQIWIGDRFRLGSALVEVSQARQPCWKINHKFQRNGLSARVIQTVRCGWYYRVIEPGTVAEGDILELVERGYENWSIARVFRAMFHHGASRGELVGVARLETLSQGWREFALMKATSTR